MSLWKRLFGTVEEKRQARIAALAARLRKLLERMDAAGDDLPNFSLPRGGGVSSKRIGFGIRNSAAAMTAFNEFLYRLGGSDRQMLEAVIDALPYARRNFVRSWLARSEWYCQARR